MTYLILVDAHIKKEGKTRHVSQNVIIFVKKVFLISLIYYDVIICHISHLLQQENYELHADEPKISHSTS